MTKNPKIINFSEREEASRRDKLKPFEYKLSDLAEKQFEKMPTKNSEFSKNVSTEKIKEESRLSDENFDGAKNKEASPENDTKKHRVAASETDSEEAAQTKNFTEEKTEQVKIEKSAYEIPAAKKRNRLFIKIFISLAVSVAVIFGLYVWMGEKDGFVNEHAESVPKKSNVLLDATIEYSPLFLTIQNNNDFDWFLCKITLKSKIDDGKYSFRISQINKQRTQRFDYVDFYSEEGKRFDATRDGLPDADIACDING